MSLRLSDLRLNVLGLVKVSRIVQETECNFSPLPIAIGRREDAKKRRMNDKNYSWISNSIPSIASSELRNTAFASSSIGMRSLYLAEK